ncbi:MAG: hypothetical protein M3077_01725 [Candidatus Dormibacteraeota bacterium]|nr:hypothetical protein [Candidatus Dormibacteraeota bacterium]
MVDSKHVYEDEWGEIIDRPSRDLIELRWFDSTVAMSKDQFQQWLSTFAEHVGRSHRHRALIDGTSFQMSPAFMDGAWRDANIIPRYNAAGVTRFAFLMPPGMPMIGKAPAPEGPARFPTGYFGKRHDALAWLTG